MPPAHPPAASPEGTSLRPLHLRSDLLPAGALLALLALALWAFSAGLGGQLIFDDEPNLLPWKSIGDIRQVSDVLALATSGVTFPGRPLSLASFVIDDQSWSPDIASLKRTNLALHLLNSCLILWLALGLLRHLLPQETETRRTWLALFVAALWTLHPLQVSNVSYVIQRMNLLSTLLELAGLLLFLHGREHLEQRPWRAFLLCSLGIGLFMPLAILAKENGLLLCAFALLLETFCFRTPGVRWWRPWKAVMLWLPLLAFLGYLLVTLRGFTAPYPTRNFTAWERLLTEGPVLVEYLDKLLMPRLHGSGLYFDNFPVSRSLLTPPWTLLAWGLLLALLALAFRLRQRLPLFSFGIFFYFTGHLMESTLLPLELYFEHRNYLPQFGLWLAVAALAQRAHLPSLRLLLRGGGVVLVLLLAWLARHNALLWSQSQLQAAVWYHDNPGSQRTTLTYANILVRQHRLDEALAVLERSGPVLPDSLIVQLANAYVRCYLQDRPVDMSGLPALAQRAQYETASLEMLDLMWKVARSTRAATTPPGRCRPLTTDEIATLYQALLDNPHYAIGRTRAALNSNLGAWAAARGDLGQTMLYYDRAFASEALPIYPYQQALFLMSAGLPGPAREYADKARASLTPRMRLQYPRLDADLQWMATAIERSTAPAGDAR